MATAVRSKIIHVRLSYICSKDYSDMLAVDPQTSEVTVKLETGIIEHLRISHIVGTVFILKQTSGMFIEDESGKWFYPD